MPAVHKGALAKAANTPSHKKLLQLAYMSSLVDQDDRLGVSFLDGKLYISARHAFADQAASELRPRTINLDTARALPHVHTQLCGQASSR